MVRTHIRAFILAAIATSASGCLTPQSDAVTGLLSRSADATVTTGTTSSGGDVYMAVDTAWETIPTVFTRHGTCQINTGDVARQKTCTIRVPEGKLFFSKTKFVFGTGNPSLCTRVEFRPAIYQVGNIAATVSALTGASTNCTAATFMDIPGIPGIPVGNLNCFQGPAKFLYANWPVPMGKYISPVIGTVNESSETMDSGNTISLTKSVSIDGNYVTNLAVANMIDDPTSDLASPGGDAVYLGGTMHPYRVTCMNDHEETLAEVLVNIADEDIETGEDPGGFNTDQFWDFGQTL